MAALTLDALTLFGDASPLEAHAQVQKGIPLTEIIRLMKKARLTQDEIAGMLGIPVRTLQRWLADPGKKLDRTTGGRYYRALKIIRHAATLLGTMAAALEWLRAEQRALGYRTPIELLTTDPGAEAVENLLGRIEYGVIT